MQKFLVPLHAGNGGTGFSKQRFKVYMCIKLQFYKDKKVCLVVYLYINGAETYQIGLVIEFDCAYLLQENIDSTIPFELLRV